MKWTQQDTESVKPDEASTELIEPENIPTESELKVNIEPIVSTVDNQPSPVQKILSPAASATETRSNDEDLLGGMDIEQISDEELEDDAKTGNQIITQRRLFNRLYTFFLLFSSNGCA